MNEKYEYMFLLYMYQLLELKEYEKKLRENGIECLEKSDKDDMFKYFSLLSKGNDEYFSDDEKRELEFLSSHELQHLLSNAELNERYNTFMKSTYKKYFFSNISGNEYISYGPPDDFEYMVPNDAIALGFNYRRFVDEQENMSYDDLVQKQDDDINDALNNIQFEKAPSKGVKVAIVKQNETSLLRDQAVSLL